MNKDIHLISEAYKLVREQTQQPAAPPDLLKQYPPDKFYLTYQKGVGWSSTPKAPDDGKHYFVVSTVVRPDQPGPTGGFTIATHTSPPISTPDGGDTIDINADVLFGFDQKTIQNDSPGMKTINGLIRKLVEAVPQLGGKKYTVTVHGHTDLYELRPGYNQSLSQERAQFVAMLLQAGTSSSLNEQDPYIFKFQGHGSSQPKVKDLPYPIQGGKAPEEGRAQQAPNRRVSLTFNPPLPEPAKKLIITDIPKEPSYNRIGETPRPQQGQVFNSISR